MITGSAGTAVGSIGELAGKITGGVAGAASAITKGAASGVSAGADVAKKALEKGAKGVGGGGRGLAEATSHRYAKEGAVVVVADLNKEFADSVAQKIKSSGGRASAAVVGVTKWADVENLVSSVVKDHGRLDVIVIYGGIALFGPADGLWHDERYRDRVDQAHGGGVGGT